MQMNKARCPRTVVQLAVLFVIAMALPNLGIAADRAWLIRVAGVSVDSGAHAVDVAGTSETLSISTSSGFGFGLDLEYRASRRLGVDFGVLSATPAIGTSIDAGWKSISISASADVAMTPISAGLNVHLTPDSRFDVYLGPLIAYVIYDSFTLSAGPGLSESFSSENDVGFGANIGVDVGLGNQSRWTLSAAITYIDTTFEASPSDGAAGSTDFDPMIVGFGFGYRF
jgi:outer membrane protein W